MMPISLTLSAFGPYPDTITIVFESFQEALSYSPCYASTAFILSLIRFIIR